MKNETEHSDRQRIGLDLSAQAVAQLEKLQNDMNATSRAEVIRVALSLLARAVEWEKAGDCYSRHKQDGTFQDMQLLRF